MDEKFLYYKWRFSFRKVRKIEDWEYLLDLFILIEKLWLIILGLDLGSVGWSVGVKWEIFVKNMELRKEGFEYLKFDRKEWEMESKIEDKMLRVCKGWFCKGYCLL